MAKTHFRVSVAYGVLAAAMMAAPALAQDAAAPAAATAPATPGAAAQDAIDATALQEIVVSATRRDTDLQTTPIAISVIGAALIEETNPRNLGDLAAFVPNFSAATITGFNAASFSIRGVGQNSIIVYFEPPVAVLVDDFVIPSVQTQLLDTFDIAQVEVLRGPQGTLFGKNTTGGAVTVRTKRPELKEMTVEGQFQAGSFGTFIGQGAVNIPIGDTLAFRGVVGYQSSNGYYENGACYGPVVAFVPSKFAGRTGCGNGDTVGGQNAWAGRAKLLWEPSDNFSAMLQYEFLRDNSDSIPTVNITPKGQGFLFDTLGVGAPNPSNSDPLKNAGLTNRNDVLLEMENGQQVDVNGIYLNADYLIDAGTFTFVGGYRSQNSVLPNTYTGQAPVAADGEVLSLFDANRSDDRKTTQLELRFASKSTGKFDYVVGAFYQNDKIDFCVSQILGFLDLTGGPLPFGAWNQNPYVLCNAQEGSSTAIFAEGSYSFTPELVLTAGARYTWDDKTWYGRQQVFVQQLNGGFDPALKIGKTLDASIYNYPAGVIQVDASSSDPTWRINLGWQASPTFFTYGSYSRGYKGGGFNDQIGGFHPFVNANGTDDQAAFAQAAAATQPEYADSFELGIKTEAFDRKLRFNLTGFYVSYTDLQKQIVVPIVVGGLPNQVTTFFNAASATVKGIEAEATAIPVDGLTIRGVLGYMDGQYDEFVTPIPAGYDLATAPLDRLPEWQWTLDANYAVPVGNYKLVFNGTIHYESSSLFSQSITSEADNTFLNARTLLSASVTFAPENDKYYIRLIGQNLTDERYLTASQVVGGLWSNVQYGPPQYFGVQVGFLFGK